MYAVTAGDAATSSAPKLPAGVIVLPRLQMLVLIGCIGLIGADRLNLLAGMGTFALTPFLLLAPIAIALNRIPPLLRGQTGFELQPHTRRQLQFLPPAYLLLLVLLLSVLFGIDPEIGLLRVAGLGLVAGLAYCIAALVVSEPAPEKLVVPAVGFALLVYFVFCVGEFIAFTHGNYLDTGDAITWKTMFHPMFLGRLMPRLSGPTVDPNRAGFVLIMYLVLLDHFAPHSRHRAWMRFVIIVFIAMTLSRSAGFSWIVYEVFRLGLLWRKPSRRAVGILALAVLSLLSLAYAYREQLATLDQFLMLSDFETRLDPTKAGTEGHIELIERGLQIWESSPKTMILGIGYGSEYRELGDFFGDSKYGNFHCLYITFLADAGLPGFLLLMTLLCYPLATRKATCGAVTAILAFNITYQSHMEPMFWLILALLWSFEPRIWPRWLRIAIAPAASKPRA